MTQPLVTDHHTLWKNIGTQLLAELEPLIGSVYLDSGVKGGRGEKSFRSWLHHWLPQRVTPLQGVIVDTRSNPTSQRDVVVFDTHNCPIFRDNPDSDTHILPIEGVLGCVEVNTSIVETAKIKKDSEKIAAVKRLVCQESPPTYRALGPSHGSDYTIFRDYATRSISFGYIFSVDSKVSLEALATTLADINQGLGVDASIDGLFVLRKGYVLHCIDQGWTTTRQVGTCLASMSAEPWDVLLTMISMINQHLRLGAIGATPSLEDYFSPPNGERRGSMLANRRIVESKKYRGQPSKFHSMK